MRGRQPHRLKPVGPAHAYKTYGLKQPKSTHFRPASCAEAECRYYVQGWDTVVDEATDLGQRQAHYIRKLSGRGFTEERNEVGLTVFHFEAGQSCFAGNHQVPIGKPPLYVVRGGDWRGNPRGDVRQHTRPDDWIDDFQNHQDKLATRLARG